MNQNTLQCMQKSSHRFKACDKTPWCDMPSFAENQRGEEGGAEEEGTGKEAAEGGGKEEATGGGEAQAKGGRETEETFR